MKLVVPDPERWVLPDLLRERARELGDKPFLSFAVDQAAVSYREADERSDRLAAGLVELGVGLGDRVMAMMGNRLEFVLTWFALNKLGAFHAPINVDYRGDFLEHLVNTAQAKLMVLEDRFVKTVLASSERMPLLEELIVVGELPPDAGRLRVRPFAAVPREAAPPSVRVRPSDTYAVLFTSGTTGRSKGALMPYAHGHLLNERNLELLDLDGSGSYISELPLFHINAHMTVYGCMIVGAHARMEERFSASRWLDRLRSSGATHSSMLGVMVDFVLRQPPSEHDRDHALRSVWMVPCLPELSNRFRDRFGIERIVTSYGTSEVGMVARRVVDRSDRIHSGEVGDEFYEVQIVDEEDRPLPHGQVGEIAVRTRLPWTVTHGYFGMEERTVEAFRNLWFHTGDAGRFDEAGNLCFVDRLADRIRRRGENVASADVEYVLAGHDAVVEAAVVAVSADEEGGEDEIKACLVLQDGEAIDFDEFWAWCEERLPYFAVPRYLELCEALPKTPTEKVIKAELRVSRDGATIADRGATGRARAA
ncbi:MAG: AMP-binding protein [Solirubrobacteraceae bacterium]